VARYCWRAAASFAVVTSVALGQAALHEQSYRPLPEPSSRKMGLELPTELARRLKREALDKAERLVDRCRRRLSRRESPRFRVLFLGDSLVNGVGGERSEGGPPLPRRVCRALADKLDVQVEWRALGVTGGDLRAMRSELVPEIKRDGLAYDVVVVMCGLNDFKYLARGELRTPWAFRDELQTLLAEIRAECGDKTRIVLPALPVALASFQEPLRSYIIFIANQWDQQKQAVAAKSRQLLHNTNCNKSVLFVDAVVPPPPLPERPAQTFVASDGVHPNESGYELWAQHIAAVLYAAHSQAAPAS